MLVRNLYALIAREVSTDASDKMNSIIKIIDKFNIELNEEELKKNNLKFGQKQIGFPMAYSVATSWAFDEKLNKPTFFNFRIGIIDPKGKNLKGPEQEHLLPAGIDRINMNFNVQGLPITENGKYKLQAELLSKDSKVLAKSEYPFEIEVKVKESKLIERN